MPCIAAESARASKRSPTLFHAPLLRSQARGQKKERAVRKPRALSYAGVWLLLDDRVGHDAARVRNARDRGERLDLALVVAGDVPILVRLEVCARRGEAAERGTVGLDAVRDRTERRG